MSPVTCQHLLAFFSRGEIFRTLKANEGMGKAPRLLWPCEYLGPDIGTPEPAFGPILDQQLAIPFLWNRFHSGGLRQASFLFRT